MVRAQNRLANAFLPGSKGGPSTNLDFYYDAKNRQIARNVNGAITFNVWDDWELVEEYAPGNAVAAKFLQGAHGPVKSLLNADYYYQDSLGSTSHIASSSGALLEYYKYDLYGKPTYWNASGGQISGSNPAYNVRDLFGGERWISEMGSYDLRNRFYSPDLGRFLQPDPIGFKGDASNLYRYCGNDWANKTDPMGLQVAGSIKLSADQHNNDPTYLSGTGANWAIMMNMGATQAGFRIAAHSVEPKGGPQDKGEIHDKEINGKHYDQSSDYRKLADRAGKKAEDALKANPGAGEYRSYVGQSEKNPKD